MSEIRIRNEKESDRARISEIITLAFENDPISDKREAEIVRLMRDDSALSISLVAENKDKIVGHIAFSKVTINDECIDWYGLAPVSVDPRFQSKGIGSKLINEGIKLLKKINAKGCVLLGEPEYYGRFGYKANAQLILPGVPAEYFQALAFSHSIPSGTVKYHHSFG
ncbi:putative acetyltransferase [Sinobacterium caligoides]|uniref:Putative acetyltransferase n=1 Tax=Sinobacterium caligoides TaxID=933926 RepID=A0A3N2DDZ0_9GAMM|nr:N-acetyltransferase [Sinobacterium caligoides]ROR98009.1 putative acetyltransferase [Sinobacterium caligoides]